MHESARFEDYWTQLGASALSVARAAATATGASQEQMKRWLTSEPTELSTVLGDLNDPELLAKWDGYCQLSDRARQSAAAVALAQ